jgi:hypothetical protein
VGVRGKGESFACVLEEVQVIKVLFPPGLTVYRSALFVNL